MPSPASSSNLRPQPTRPRHSLRAPSPSRQHSHARTPLPTTRRGARRPQLRTREMSPTDLGSVSLRGRGGSINEPGAACERCPYVLLDHALAAVPAPTVRRHDAARCVPLARRRRTRPRLASRAEDPRQRHPSRARRRVPQPANTSDDPCAKLALCAVSRRSSSPPFSRRRAPMIVPGRPQSIRLLQRQGWAPLCRRPRRLPRRPTLQRMPGSRARPNARSRTTRRLLPSGAGRLTERWSRWAASTTDTSGRSRAPRFL